MDDNYKLLNEDYMLTAKEYYALYCHAFAKLDQIATLAEDTMRELEELQLKMGDSHHPAPVITLLPPPQRHKE